MVNFGYKQCDADHTIFIKHIYGKITMLIVYVDDMVVTGDDHEEIVRFKKYFTIEFEIKDLGRLRCFLGIEVARSDKGIFLSQWKYVLDLLKGIGMLRV